MELIWGKAFSHHLLIYKEKINSLQMSFLKSHPRLRPYCPIKVIVILLVWCLLWPFVAHLATGLI